MSAIQKIEISAPREIKFGCQSLGGKTVRCSRAFPDLVKFSGHFYLAFRTAPSHFPSNKAKIQIFSSEKPSDWQPEHSIHCDLDLRDPHFLIFKGGLYLFFMSHSSETLNHEPERIFYVKKMQDGWSEPVALPLEKSGFWNVKSHDDKVYMSIYTRNGEANKRTKRHFAMMASKDLVEWRFLFSSPVTREKLNNYQTSETSFEFDSEGNIFGTIRSLIYPNLNFFIPASQPDQWKIRVDRFKCDGPKLFCHKDRYFLVGRRSMFYRLRSEPFRLFNGLRNFLNIIRYSFSKKRTAIYQFDPEKLEINHITDLPSHGDTGYSAVAHITGNQYLLIYYSSEIGKGNDYSWLRGQAGSTKLYASTLTIG